MLPLIKILSWTVSSCTILLPTPSMNRIVEEFESTEQGGKQAKGTRHMKTKRLQLAYIRQEQGILLTDTGCTKERTQGLEHL